MRDEILTLCEVAKYLKLAEKTAYRLVPEGRFPGLRVGGIWHFWAVDVKKRIEEQKVRQ